MFDLGARRRKDGPPMPMFNDKDVQRLVDILPPSKPQDSAGSSNCLLRTFQGDELIRSDTVKDRLKNILETYDALIPVSSLPRVLNIQSIESLLDPNELLYTEDRQNLVPELLTQGILDGLEAQCQANFVAFTDFAESRDLRRNDLRQVVTRKREDLAFLDVHGMWITSKSHLHDIETRLRKALQEAQDAAAVTYIDRSNFEAPRIVIAHLARVLLSDMQCAVKGDIIVEENGYRFTPRSALQREASQAKEQHENLVRQIVSDVQHDGYYIHTQEGGSSSALVTDVKDRWRQQSLLLEVLEDQSSICFITTEHLLSVRKAISWEAMEIAGKSYHERDIGTDVVFGSDVLQSLTKSSKTPQLTSILFSKDPQLPSRISSSFAERLSVLQSRVQTTFQNAVRAQLLAPTQLYTAGCGLVSDPSLRSKLISYTHEYLQKDLLPAAVASILNPSTIPSKAVYAEALKLQTSLSEASTIDDIETALRRLARRTKINTSFRDNELQCIKRDILETKIKNMKSMKRDSDVLQNLLWILLATVPFPASESGIDPSERKEALWVSSGKDTTRMIKFYRQIAETVQGEQSWAAWGEELSNFRDAVKEGKSSESIKEDMAALAEGAVRSWLDNGHLEPTEETSERAPDT
ncbi:hypothetical protein MBLNU457_4150t1 [Dothideomycetes sp. NU457]